MAHLQSREYTRPTGAAGEPRYDGTVGGDVSDLRVPKRRLTVELVQRRSDPGRFEVFLAEHQDHSWHRQEVLDLLEEDTPFFPAHDETTDGWVLIRRDSLVWVAISGMELVAAADLGDLFADDGPGVALFDYRHHVRLDLVEGRTLEGQLLYSAPPEQARVIDHMNAPSRFVRVFTADRVYLVAKAAIVRLWDIPEK
jgi:hypothetical protein